jgi:hypothetical protein
LAQRNIYAYQVDFHNIKKGKDGKDVRSEFWDYNTFVDLLEDLLEQDQKDIKLNHSGWFHLLDSVEYRTIEVKEKIEGKETMVQKNCILGKFLYAEYGYKANYRDVDTLDSRISDKTLREGEERFVHFYIGEDGLLLLQGSQRLVRSKFEQYFQDFGNEFFENRGINLFTVSTLLKGDFIDEVNKLDNVMKIEVELAVEKPSSYENEVMKTARDQAIEFEANYAQIVWQRKYKKSGGLKGYVPFLSKIKPKGLKKPIQGVNNIKVLGNQNGELKRVYLSKISEKYTINVELDDNNQVIEESIYDEIRGVGSRREEIWRKENEQS